MTADRAIELVQQVIANLVCFQELAAQLEVLLPDAQATDAIASRCFKFAHYCASTKRKELRNASTAWESGEAAII